MEIENNISKDEVKKENDRTIPSEESCLLCSTNPISLPILGKNLNYNDDYYKSQNFVKNFEAYKIGNENYIVGWTENSKLLVYNLEHTKDELNTTHRFQKLTEQHNSLIPIYDACLLNDCEKNMLIMSKKDHPIMIYDLKQEENKWNIECVASLQNYYKNSERFQVPLQLKTYRNQLKEPQLFCVGKQFLYSYDLNKLKISFKRDIISCLDLPKPQTLNEDLVYGIVAFGKFDKEVCLLSKEDDKIFGKLKVHVDGVTSVKFSPTDSVFLFTAARKDDLVYQWDLRKYDKFLNYFQRRCATNQRMTFDLSSDGKEILLGNEDGTLISYDIANKKPTKFLKAHSQCCNTVKFYDYNESSSQYCLSSGGERTFLNEDQSIEEQQKQNEDCDSLKFWKLANL